MSTSGRPAAASSAATMAADCRRYGAAAGSPDTDGIRTRRSRSARTDGRTCCTAWSRVMNWTLPQAGCRRGPTVSGPLGRVEAEVGGEALGYLQGHGQVGVADDDHAVGDEGGPPV